MLPELTPLAWAAASLAVTAGVVTQRATGGAFGMVVAPLVALVAPQHLPAGVLLIALPATALSTPRRLGDVAVRELAPAAFGRLVGAAAAASAVALAPDPQAVAALVALAVLAGVALSLSGLRLRLGLASLFGAGALSGLMGTLTSVGAPPMQLLYQHEAAARARATLNAFFTLGVALSLGALLWKGQVDPPDLGFALAMTPALGLGFLIARPVVRRLEGRPLRPLVLALATLAAAAALLRAVAA
jgi:uncharacterized membrane protein YfcA